MSAREVRHILQTLSDHNILLDYKVDMRYGQSLAVLLDTRVRLISMGVAKALVKNLETQYWWGGN